MQSVDNRIFKNGNRLFFLEPMESSSSQAYISWVRMVDIIFLMIKILILMLVINYIKQIEFCSLALSIWIKI